MMKAKFLGVVISMLSATSFLVANGTVDANKENVIAVEVQAEAAGETAEVAVADEVAQSEEVVKAKKAEENKSCQEKKSCCGSK
jgi:hypothetical protein